MIGSDGYPAVYPPWHINVEIFDGRLTRRMVGMSDDVEVSMQT
jgi:hypothetical protein